MKAAILTGIREMEIRDIPGPGDPGNKDVLLKVEVIGVCGSDLHYYKTGRIGDQVVEFPFMVGHECSATVVKTGSEVTTLSEGDRIAVDPLVWCHKCDQCLKGRVHTCRNQKFLGCPNQLDGCLCEYIIMPEASCFKLPDAVDLVQGALIEPFCVGYYAQQLAQKDLTGKTVAIFGTGPIGLSVLLAAKAAGAEKIYTTEIRDCRGELALNMGADYFGNPEKTDVVAEILSAQPNGVDYSFECAGEQSTLDQCIDVTTPGSKLMMIGIPTVDRVSFVIAQTRRNEITIQPVRRQNHCVTPSLDLMAEGKVNLDPMVTHNFGLDDTKQAFDLVAEYSDSVVKAMIHL